MTRILMLAATGAAALALSACGSPDPEPTPAPADPAPMTTTEPVTGTAAAAPGDSVTIGAADTAPPMNPPPTLPEEDPAGMSPSTGSPPPQP